jgi:hypothetical protein
MQIKVPGQWRSSGLGKVMSKKPAKRRHGRYLLKAASAYKWAVERRDGSSGAASPVRHVQSRAGWGCLKRARVTERDRVQNPGSGL